MFNPSGLEILQGTADPYRCMEHMHPTPTPHPLSAPSRVKGWLRVAESGQRSGLPEPLPGRWDVIGGSKP